MLIKWISLLLTFVGTTFAAQCTFTVTPSRGYVCYLSNGYVVQESDDFVITGTHLDGRTNDDVQAVTHRSNNTLRFIPPQLTEIFPYLEVIQLFESGIEVLSPNALTNCRDLERIELNLNSIRSIPAGFLNHCARLSFFTISNNLVNHIDEGAFTGLNLLSDMHFTQNQIHTIPSDLFATQYELLRLFLRDNLIDTIGEGAFRGLQSIRSMNFENNLIGDQFGKHLFSSSPFLESFTLNINDIDEIPRMNTSGMTFYWLQGNNIETIEDDIFELLPNLVWIDFNNNNLTVLNAAPFEGLENLETINFQDNRIEAVDPELFDKIPSLLNIRMLRNTCINLNFVGNVQNNANLLPAFEECFYNYVDAGTAKCTFVDDEVYGYTCVVSGISYQSFRDKFVLSGDHIDGRTNDDVTGLIIEDSNFVKIPESVFSSFPSLQNLKISGMPEEINEKTFSVCSALNILDLSGNSIKSLTEGAFLKCGSIESLILDNNPIEDVREDNINLFNVYIGSLSMRNDI